MAAYTPRPGSKVEMIINYMKANADKDMDTVCVAMLEFVQTNMADVRSYYRWAVKNDIAPGMVVGGRVSSPRKTKEVPAKKLLKEVGIKTTAYAPVFLETKSDDEIARIKAANLAKLKALSSKMKRVRVVEDEPVTLTDEQDMFMAPISLTMDEVKALV
jgi:hypothetical protein